MMADDDAVPPKTVGETEVVETETVVETQAGDILPPVKPTNEIRRHWRAIDTIREAVEQTATMAALEIGRHLIELKKLVKRGEWLPALETHGFKERSAELAMDFARHVDAKGPSNPKHVSDLLKMHYRDALAVVRSVRAAKKAALAPPKKAAGPEPVTLAEIDAAGRQLLMAEDVALAKEQVAAATEAIASTVATEPAAGPQLAWIPSDATLAELDAKLEQFETELAATEEVPVDSGTEPEAETIEPTVEELLKTEAGARTLARRMWAEFGPAACDNLFQAFGELREEAEAEEAAAAPVAVVVARPRVRVRESVRVS